MCVLCVFEERACVSEYFECHRINFTSIGLFLFRFGIYLLFVFVFGIVFIFLSSLPLALALCVSLSLVLNLFCVLFIHCLRYVVPNFAASSFTYCIRFEYIICQVDSFAYCLRRRSRGIMVDAAAAAAFDPYGNSILLSQTMSPSNEKYIFVQRTAPSAHKSA